MANLTVTIRAYTIWMSHYVSVLSLIFTLRMGLSAPGTWTKFEMYPRFVLVFSSSSVFNVHRRHRHCHHGRCLSMLSSYSIRPNNMFCMKFKQIVLKWHKVIVAAAIESWYLSMLPTLFERLLEFRNRVTCIEIDKHLSKMATWNRPLYRHNEKKCMHFIHTNDKTQSQNWDHLNKCRCMFSYLIFHWRTLVFNLHLVFFVC